MTAVASLLIAGDGRELHVAGDRVASPGTSIDEHTSILDAAGCHVLPGFVDVQVNGAIGVDLTTQPESLNEVAEFLPQCGVTSFVPTVISCGVEETRRAVDVIGSAVQARRGRGARPLGLHLEGPFLNPERRGAHPGVHLRPPTAAETHRWTVASGVTMVTLAPELPGGMQAIERLVAAGVTVCAGHSSAGAEVLRQARRAGLTGVTHLFNAMSPMSARSPGLAGATLSDDALIAGLIVDGLHVDAAMVRVAWKVLGPERIALVSDAMAALGLASGEFVIGSTPVTVSAHDGARTSEGVLAGSVLRFDEAVRNLIAATDCSLEDASIAASRTPARLIGHAEIGALDEGCMADIVVLDADLRVVATVVGGVVVFDPQQRCSTGVAAWKS